MTKNSHMYDLYIFNIFFKKENNLALIKLNVSMMKLRLDAPPSSSNVFRSRDSKIVTNGNSASLVEKMILFQNVYTQQSMNTMST